MNSLVNDTKIGKFLPITARCDSLWASTDDESNYMRNLKSQPADWYYRDNTITYTTNSMGYRTQEFNDIDWEKSIVLFGCSAVFGVGLDDSNTISHYLSQITGCPVVNMGAVGTSIQFSFHNNIMLSKLCRSPKAVVNIWTAIDRCLYYNKESIQNSGPWSTSSGDYYANWSATGSHADTNAVLLSTASRQLWKNSTKYYEASFFKPTALLLDIPVIRPIDSARDLVHVGMNTARITARYIADALA